MTVVCVSSSELWVRKGSILLVVAEVSPKSQNIVFNQLDQSRQSHHSHGSGKRSLVAGSICAGQRSFIDLSDIVTTGGRCRTGGQQDTCHTGNEQGSQPTSSRGFQGFAQSHGRSPKYVRCRVAAQIWRGIGLCVSSCESRKQPRVQSKKRFTESCIRARIPKAVVRINPNDTFPCRIL